MPENGPKTRLTDRKRAEILKAAVKLFRSRGFDTTSMDAVAKEAKVSKRTVYNHFPSKEALFDSGFTESLWRIDRIAPKNTEDVFRFHRRFDVL